ncbi:MAG: hypothetical protein IJZ26_00690 [Clostridia bacterium]|nr:hypothetical protein [Clostridia bacterium]
MKFLPKTMAMLFLCIISLMCCGSYQPEEEVEIKLYYQNAVWLWNDNILLNQITNFEQWGKAQKNNRMGNRMQRVELVKEINALGFSLEDSFEYVFYGIKEKINNICNFIDKQAVDAKMDFNPNSITVFKFTK